MKKAKVVFIEPPGQQGYMPIASAYLVAYACKDPIIAHAFSFVFNFRHFHDPIEQVLEEILQDGVPDIAAFSCQGWAIVRADLLAQRLRALNPSIAIVYGGNHVSHQGHAFFAGRSFVDVLINGEGEITFYEFLLSYLRNRRPLELSHIRGVSYCDRNGAVVTTDKRDRFHDLNEIPSPYLTGILEVTRENCATALLETNRGCPYSCSYCYWGGAIGQKLYTFSEERLREELELLARRNIDSLYICDANFGILPRDADLVEYIVSLRQKYGYPKTLHTNWAKNSNERIVKMCARLNNANVHSTYTLAMQTTTKYALQLANRSNMKINQVEEISMLCRNYGVVPRGELIWGLPGESYREFLNSYDTLAEYTDALTVYPHYLLPNTEYMSKIDEYKIKIVQGEFDTDYVYCVEHMDMTEDDFLKGLKFIISNNLLKVGGVFFRLYPRVAKVAAGIRYSKTIEAFGDWILVSGHPLARRFKKYYRFPLATHRQSLGEVWQAFSECWSELVDMFRCYVEETFHEQLDSETKAILRGAFEFDVATYPYFDSEQEDVATEGDYYVKRVECAYDYLAFKLGEAWNPAPGLNVYRVMLPKGLWHYPLDNWYFSLLSYQGKVEHWKDMAVMDAERSKTSAK